MSEKKYDVSFLQSCGKDLSECFRIYTEDINPFIVKFETENGNFPIELQNEIRSIYGHLCKAALADTPQIAAENVKKIKSHSKRALLDCFKYISVIHTDNYSDFMERYKGVDLTYIDNGKFLSNIDALYAQTKEKLQAAKVMELKGVTDEELFKAYQEAFSVSSKMNSALLNAEQSAAFLKKKATKKEIAGNISLVVGVVSLIASIIFFILGKI